MSQEQLADQVARASEERQTIEQRLQQAEKVVIAPLNVSHGLSHTYISMHIIVCICL